VGHSLLITHACRCAPVLQCSTQHQNIKRSTQQSQRLRLRNMCAAITMCRVYVRVHNACMFTRVVVRARACPRACAHAHVRNICMYAHMRLRAHYLPA
jgi:hypothetical protein